MKEQLAETEHKLKKVRSRTKDDEKKYSEYHTSVVNIEERCRNMNEIIKFRAVEVKKGFKEVVSIEDIREMEDNYEAMIFEKEEN